MFALKKYKKMFFDKITNFVFDFFSRSINLMATGKKINFAFFVQVV